MGIRLPLYVADDTQFFHEELLSKKTPASVLYEGKRSPVKTLKRLLKKHPVLYYSRFLYLDAQDPFGLCSVVCLRKSDFYKVNVDYPVPATYPMLRVVFAWTTPNQNYSVSVAPGTFSLNRNLVRLSDHESLDQCLRQYQEDFFKHPEDGLYVNAPECIVKKVEKLDDITLELFDVKADENL